MARRGSALYCGMIRYLRTGGGADPDPPGADPIRILPRSGHQWCLNYSWCGVRLDHRRREVGLTNDFPRLDESLWVLVERFPSLWPLAGAELLNNGTLYPSMKAVHTGRLWLNFNQNSRNIVLAKIWHWMALMALQDNEKPIRYWKRPTKAEKVILKAVESKIGKVMIFFAFCNHLVTKIKGIQYFDVSRSKRPKRPH